jgi:hypothetical protein
MVIESYLVSNWKNKLGIDQKNWTLTNIFEQQLKFLIYKTNNGN